MWIIFALIIVLVICSAILKTPRVRGWLGEFCVKLCIGKTKIGEQYVVNDLRIRTEDGKTSQIDHVVIRPNGFFVIETKNYSGRIYGSEKQLEWTQVLRYGKVKNKLYNPLKQNNTHLYRIDQIIDHAVPLISAIVFVQGNIQYIQAPNVYSLSGLKKLLRTPASSQITVSQMEEFYNILIKEKEDAQLSTSEHVANIHKMQEQIQANVCPRCGGALVERHHNGSTFWGCSNYPKCRFTKK